MIDLLLKIWQQMSQHLGVARGFVGHPAEPVPLARSVRTRPGSSVVMIGQWMWPVSLAQLRVPAAIVFLACFICFLIDPWGLAISVAWAQSSTC